MPDWVKDESAWAKAKARVQAEYPAASGDRFWRLVTAIYQCMTGATAMSKAHPLPVIFLKAVRRGDTQTLDLLGANPAMMPDTHLELRTRKDGVNQMYHISNAAPDAAKQAPGLGLDLGAPAAPADPLAGIAATDPRREHVHHLATVDAPRAQRAAALLAAMTRNDLGALGRLFGAMSLKEAEASSLDIGLAVPRARSKQELLNYIQPELLAEIRKRQG